MVNKKNRVFLTSPHNNPSGGVKVLNQVCNLFNEKGYESYLALSGRVKQAEWMNNPAPIISLKDMKKLCKSNDIIIDSWQKEDIWKTTMSCPAKIKVFWSHGASIPIGKDYVGPKVFASNNGYTHQWNVSKACKDYIARKYNLRGIRIVHPFFDDELMNEFLIKKRQGDYKRNGILILWRRGAKYIPHIVRNFCSDNKITVIYGNFSVRDLYDSLLRHRFFVSIDHGVTSHNFKVQSILNLKSLINRQKNLRNSWLLPKGSILGFPMTAAEAAMLGTTVIGFPMGGGLEWMKRDNCFMAHDKNLKSLLNEIQKAMNSNESLIEKKTQNAFNSIKKFNKENTWKEITKSIGKYLEI